MITLSIKAELKAESLLELDFFCSLDLVSITVFGELLSFETYRLKQKQIVFTITYPLFHHFYLYKNFLIKKEKVILKVRKAINYNASEYTHLRFRAI